MMVLPSQSIEINRIKCLYSDLGLASRLQLFTLCCPVTAISPRSEFSEGPASAPQELKRLNKNQNTGNHVVLQAGHLDGCNPIGRNHRYRVTSLQGLIRAGLQRPSINSTLFWNC